MAKVELTPEIREQLLGVLPFSDDATVEYTPEAYKDIPEDYWPTFKLRPFTKKEESAVKRSATSTGKSAMSLETEAEEKVRGCLLGWENLIDAGTGDAVEYAADDNGGCKKELFDRLPALIITDLFLYISKISGLSDVEKRSLR